MKPPPGATRGGGGSVFPTASDWKLPCAVLDLHCMLLKSFVRQLPPNKPNKTRKMTQRHRMQAKHML